MRKESRTRNSLINIATGIGGQILSIILKFVTRTVFIHTLGTSYIGINGLFSNILTMLSLTELGLDAAINFKLYKPLAERDEHRVRVLMKFYKQAYRVIGFVILLIGLAIIPTLRFIIKDYDSLEVLGINAVFIFILYLLQSVSSYLFFGYRSAVIKAAQKNYIINNVEIIMSVITNITQIIILYIWQDFVLYTASALLFIIVQNGVNAIFAQKMFPNFFTKEEGKLTKNEVIDLFKDCGALFVYRMNSVALKSTDNLVLSTFIGLKIVGLYSNYLMFYTTISTFLSRIYSSVKASMGNLFATAEISKSYFFFEVMNLITVIFYGTACIGVAVLANDVIEVWIGPDYIIPQPLPILIGIEILLRGLKTNLGQIRNISGAFRQMWFRPVLSVIINLVVSVIMVQFWGIYGVLIGTIAADVLTNLLVDPKIIHEYSFKQYKPVSYYYKKNGIYLITLLAVGVIVAFLRSVVLPGRGWIWVITHILICGIIAPAALILLNYRKPECKYLIQKARTIGKGIVNRIHQ